MQKLGKVFFQILVFALFLNKGVSAASFTAPGDSTKAKKGHSTKSTTKSTSKESSKSSAKAPAKSSSKAKDENTTDQPLVLHPIVRLGTGLLSYIGNAKTGTGSSIIQSPASGRIGYELGIAQKLSPVTEFNLYFLYGNLAVTDRTPTVNWNFQSTIAGGGINLLFKILPKQEVTPYVIAGVESYEFLSRADIYDKNGFQYYNWTDGSLRSLPQTSPNAASAKVLYQSYNYSTDIRSLNLDGSGKYTQQTFAIPLGIGLMFHVGTRADFMLGTTLHFTFTDHIDGLTPQVNGALKGSLSNDMFVMTYASIRFNLTRDHPKTHRYDDIDKDPYLAKDTVHPNQPGKFDTSLYALQHQYEMYTDSTGKFGKRQVDPFHWKVANAIPDNSGPKTTVPTKVTPANTTNASSDAVIYKIQLLATYVKLAEGITFAGINDRASVDVDRGMYRYTTGNFTDYNEALKYYNQLRAIGYTDAFIRATKNGKDVAVNAGHPSTSAATTTTAAKTATPTANSWVDKLGTGLVFKLQLGVFGSIAPDQAFMSTLNQFKDVVIIKDNAGLSHYLVGGYKDFASATAARDQMKTGGIKDACVMAFNNGRYISNADAINLQKK